MACDHTAAPLLDALRVYRDDDMTPFTTPGHKRGSGITAETLTALGREVFVNDIPVASGVDDTHTTREVVAQAERLAADAFGADRTFFLLNGSSIGNQVALLSVAAPGDEVIVARNVHKSIMAALILSGARPIYVRPRYDDELEVAHGLEPADLATALAAHPHARAVVMVSPTYFGVTADLPALAEVCHAAGVPLLVDEAWAPHFAFHPGLPPSAMQAGADCGVSSIHKVLSGFTQSSVLNIKGARIDAARVAAWLDLLQTTSPSALILASIDGCRRQMALHGRELLDRTIALAAMARARLGVIPGVHVLGREVVGRPGAAGYDPSKLVIDVGGTGLSGVQLDQWLRERRHVTVEMSDHRRIVALLSIADTERSVAALVDGIAAAVASHGRSAPVATAATANLRTVLALETESVLTPAQAFHAPSRSVPLAAAAGQVSADVVTPYPPGIPLLAPGERVSAAVVAYLRSGLERDMHVTGASDHSLATLRVIA